MKRLNGIRLPLRKKTEDKPVAALPLPQYVRIPMLMHRGTPCVPTVEPDDYVTVGQVIGKPADDMAVPIHASVSGTVTAITDYTLPDGNVVPCVEIESDGSQTVSRSCRPPQLNNRADLINAAKESGCVGCSGSGYLTYQKLAAADKFTMLIVNGAESEPYLTADCRLMVETPDDVIGGIALIMKLLKIKEARIGIQTDKPAAIRLMSDAAEKQKGISVIPLPPLYPQGAEKVMIFHTCGVIVPEGKTSADCGILELNVGTCAFLYRYSQTGIPLTERVVTVAGSAVGSPANLRVPVGTPVTDLLDECSCDYDKMHELLCGGPMMGQAIANAEDAVILRQQNALLARKGREFPEPSACMRCGACMKACPLNLMPTEIDRAFEQRDLRTLKQLHTGLCMNCGSCTYVCPAHRPLAETVTRAKAAIAQD